MVDREFQDGWVEQPAQATRVASLTVALLGMSTIESVFGPEGLDHMMREAEKQLHIERHPDGGPDEADLSNKQDEVMRALELLRDMHRRNPLEPAMKRPPS